MEELLELKAQYRVLSETEDYFPRGSKHKAALFIDKKLREILNRIAELEK